MTTMIEVSHITKDYGGGRGVFDVSFAVNRGEVMGFLGPNGAGKTTTIRQLMGFTRPDKGSVRIGEMDCFAQAAQIERSLGYLPGEIAFMDDMTGIQFIRFIAGMKGLRDLSRAEELMRIFELDPSGRIKKMSKGMKQKIGIVCAFMQSPRILILDEPTSGLDPLMQNRFVELILHEKEQGATILMSSHDFEEVERTCDRTVIIREGRIVAVENMERLRKNRSRIFILRFASPADAADFAESFPRKTVVKGSVVTVDVAGEVAAFLRAASEWHAEDLDLRRQTLEEFFLQFYGEGEGKTK